MNSLEQHNHLDPKTAELLATIAQDARDAARYRYLRDGNWRECEKLEPVIRLQLNGRWDSAIDAAIRQRYVQAQGPQDR